jgi:hypothetical protein
MSLRSGAVGVACLIVIGAGSAAGAAETQEHEWRAACTHDALVHCLGPALRRDRSGVRECLIQRLTKISARCRAVVEGATADNVRTTEAGARLDAGAESSPENELSPR